MVAITIAVVFNTFESDRCLVRHGTAGRTQGGKIRRAGREKALRNQKAVDRKADVAVDFWCESVGSKR